MTHRLYDETCFERWTRLKYEKARFEEAAEKARRRLEHEESSRRKNKRRPSGSPYETPAPRRDDDGIVSMPSPISTWSDPSPTIDPSPSTIDPGGGSSGGGGADGTF
jgi:hypothetical protein